jgi:hypothetical protein
MFAGWNIQTMPIHVPCHSPDSLKNVRLGFNVASAQAWSAEMCVTLNMAPAAEEDIYPFPDKSLLRRGFMLPFPFRDMEILTDYLHFLDGDIPSLLHLPLTEIELVELEAWEESCRFLLEREDGRDTWEIKQWSVVHHHTESDV